MKKYILTLLLLTGINALAQQALNNYKYVVIPSKYEFQKKEDQFGVNTLLKFKFQQLGFETYLDNEDLPKSLKENRCLALTPVIKDAGGMFKTKLSVEVKDCYDKVLFVTKEGFSRSKSYDLAYKEALRNTLTSFGGYRLHFAPKETATKVVSSEVALHEVKVPHVTTANQMQFSFNNDEYLFIKKKTGFSIESKNSTKAIGSCIASTLKTNIYHVELNSKKGIGYFLENGNFMLEIVDNDSVQLLTMVKTN